MKVINRVTLHYLKENKKRTILTILCIMVSVIMISCVGISFYSGKQFYKEYIEQTVGDYHYCIVDNNQYTIDLIKNDNQVEEYYFSNSQSLNYKDHDVYMKNGNFDYFKKMNYQQYLSTGRLPQNSNEIVLTQAFLDLIGENKKVGDSITLEQTIEISDSHEETKSYNFLIVGIAKNLKMDNRYGTIYDTLSYIDLSENEYYTIYIKDKDVSSHIFTHAKSINDQVNEHFKNNSNHIEYNSSLLAIQDIFESDSHSTFLNLYSMVAGLLAIIVFISLFIIYQAFHLSTGDRIQYLGMLSSVGATPKQKRRSVYFEGFILSLISIPLGIFMSFIGLIITFFFVNQLEIIQTMGISISAHISIEYLIIVILISFLTIFISLYLPARKISRISVIDALKKNDEIKIKSKKLKNNLISKKFLKINQQLAVKNYKRQGRRSKVIVFSLVISMVSFIAIFRFGNNMNTQYESAQTYKSYDIQVNISDDKKQKEELESTLDKNDDIENYYYYTDNYGGITAQVDGSCLTPEYKEFISNETMSIAIIGVNDEMFEKLCQENEIDKKNNQVLVYNKQNIYYNQDNKNIAPIQKINNQFFQSIQYEYNDTNHNIHKMTLPLFENVDLIKENKYGLYTPAELCVIVPIDYALNIEQESAKNLCYYIVTSEHEKVSQQLTEAHYHPYDYAASIQQQRQMVIVIQIFIYGFVFIMIFFTLMNIVNMMSASIDKRKKEFAMMLSVGMSPRGIQRMILNESLIYGLKTLIYGVPLSIIFEYFLFIMTYGSVNDDVIFEISFVAYVIAFIIIMLVMFITFRFCLRKLKKQNIIESLKDDM